MSESVLNTKSADIEMTNLNLDKSQESTNTFETENSLKDSKEPENKTSHQSNSRNKFKNTRTQESKLLTGLSRPTQPKIRLADFIYPNNANKDFETINSSIYFYKVISI
jgi:hypothetical protein